MRAAPEGPPKVAGSRYGRAVEPFRLWRAVSRAKWILLAVAISSAVCGVVVGKTLVKRTYASEVHLLWEPSEQERMDPNTRDLFTRIDSVKLPRNLALIRQRLSLSVTLVQLAGRIDLRFDPDSNLVTLEATAETPDASAALADTAADVFLSSERELARTRLAEDVQTTRRDLDNARNELSRARTGYDDFRREHGISDLALETQQAIESAANLSARAAIERDRARHMAALGTKLRRPTDLHSSADREQARSRLSEARGRLAQARAQYSDEHPRVQALISEVEQLEAALRGSALQDPFATGDPLPPGPIPVRPVAPRQDGGASIDTTYTRLETQARERLAHLSAIEGQASSLLASVRVAETRVSELEAALARAEDLARSASPGFRIVSPATRPEAPVKSFRRVIAIAVPVLSLLFAILGVLLWALRGLRVYTANEVAYWGRAPVIGSSTWPLPPHTLKALIDELGDYTPDARGTTLVVAATAKEESLAEAVASRLQMAAPTAVEAVGYGGTVPVDVRVVDTTAEDVSGYRPRDTLEDVGRVPLRPASMAIVPANAGGGPGQAIAAVSASESMPKPAYVIDLWKGQLTGPQLRRAARLADRVIVVVSSGALSVRAVADIATRLGRNGGAAFLVLGMPSDLAGVSDRVGPVEAFWLNRR